MEKILPTPPDPRVARLMRVVGHFERDQIEAAVDGLIALLDAADGDPDIEPNGDDLGDQSGDWRKISPFYADIRPADVKDGEAALAFEDSEDDDPLEDDDPAGGNIEDVPHDAEEDMGAEELGEPGSWPEGQPKGWGGDVIGDDEREPEDFAQVARHRNRIRRTRCDRVEHGNRLAAWSTWRLRDPAAQAVMAVRP